VLEFQPFLHVVASPTARLGRVGGAMDDGDVGLVTSAQAASADVARAKSASVSGRADMSSPAEWSTPPRCGRRLRQMVGTPTARLNDRAA
jgi:hypothetical protein